MSSITADIIRETFSSLAKAIGVQIDIPDEMIANLAARLQAQIDLLAELQSTGRLLVDDETRLTAEEWADVEALVAAANPYSAPAARLRALFPATEPAAEAKPCGSNSVTLGWCKLTARHEGLHTNGTHLWGTPSEPDPPAPVEPAEEAPNLAAVAQEPRRFDPADECQNDNHDPGCTCGAQHWMTALAPAEPAEEETKAEEPWIVHLPEGVTMEQWIESLPDEAPGLLAAVREVRERLGISSPVVPAPTETEAGLA